MGALIDDREVACNAVVRASNALKFSALARRTETRAVVLHWTGGRGLAPQVYRTLRERGLSVHFCIEPDGTIWQYADAALRCAHAGAANGWSIGVEIVNLAGGMGEVGRRMVHETMHGKPLKYTSFTDAQTAAALELTATLTRAYGLPMRAPTAAGVLSTRELVTYRGVLGHFHLTTQKRDPGLELMAAVNGAARG